MSTNIQKLNKQIFHNFSKFVLTKDHVVNTVNTYWMAINSTHFIGNQYSFFYRNKLYKNNETEIGKKDKNKLRTF